MRYKILAGIFVGLALTISYVGYDGPDHTLRPDLRDGNEKYRNLKFGKASCMHCPMYFRFEADTKTINALITEQELVAVSVVPQQMQQAISLFKETWWVDQNTFQTAQKYWVEYEPQRPGDAENRMRLAIVAGNTVYFANDGQVDPAIYKKVSNLISQ